MLFAAFRFARRVERGSALLDEREPGWFRIVSPSSLNICSENHCVLGQIARHRHGIPLVAAGTAERGGFSFMIERLRVRRPLRNGFITFGGKERIERLWRAAIDQRRAGAPQGAGLPAEPATSTPDRADDLVPV